MTMNPFDWEKESFIEFISVLPYENEVRGEELKAGEWFTFPGATQNVYRVTGIIKESTGTRRFVGSNLDGEEREFYQSDSFIRLEKAEFNCSKSPKDMDNSEALQVVFDYMIRNTPSLKEAIISNDNNKKTGILKDTIKGGYGAFTKGLMFAVRQEKGPDKKVEMYVSKEGNVLAFKVSNFRDLIGRYFFGDETIRDVAPPIKEVNVLVMNQAARLTLIDGSIVEMKKYLGSMGTKVWGWGSREELIHIPQAQIKIIEPMTQGIE